MTTPFRVVRSTRVIRAAEEYRLKSQQVSLLRGRLVELKADLLREMGDDAKVRAGDHLLVATRVSERPPGLITDDMVGNEIPGRAAYVTLEVR